MKRRPLAGASVSVVGQGTWEMEKTRAASVRALRRGLDLGMTHIDTAEMYGSGACEEIVAEAIAGLRDEAFIVSKVLPSNATHDGTLAACERSLRRLRTDRLDLYLLHWRDATPLAETFRAFDRLLRDGKIRAFGVSNFDVADLQEAWAIDRRIACNQVLYHLKERAIEHSVLPWCRAHGVPVVAYSPYGEGDFPPDVPRASALAFLARETFVIPKSSNVEHVEENARAGNLDLTAAEIAAIDRAQPRGAPRPLPMI